MPELSHSFHGSLIPAEPARPVEDAEGSASGWEATVERIAGELYGMASMLLGEGEDAISVVEQIVGGSGIPVTDDYAEVRHAGRVLTAAQSIAILSGRDAAALAAPEIDPSGAASCIEGDELDAAGVTSAELEAMLTGPDSSRLRSWIESLPAALRVTFVLRAVAGLNSAEVAGLLAEHGGPDAEGWTPEAVRTIFRQGLCSLAAQLLHATAER